MFCSDDIEINHAKLSFSSTLQNFTVLVKNTQCFNCDYLELDISQCNQAYTPYSWHFKLQNHSQDITHLEYIFGNIGEYSLYLDKDNLKVQIVSAPENSMMAFWVFFGLALAFLFTMSLTPYLIEWVYEKEKKYLAISRFVASFDERFNLDRIFSPEAFDQQFQAPLLSDSEPTDTRQNNTPVSKQTATFPSPSKARVESLDTFRGLTLFFMIFVNYGGGGYWFLDHSPWNGMTFADLLFPWFIWMMGVSMALSFSVQDKKNVSSSSRLKKSLIRSVKLFAIGLLLNNGYDLLNWRIPGVLQYFAFANFVTSLTVLLCRPLTARLLKQTVDRETQFDYEGESLQNPNLILWNTISLKGLKNWSWVLLAYRYEFLVQGGILLLYLIFVLWIPAPGCPAGYNGPAGLSLGLSSLHPSPEYLSRYQFCPPGGIHSHVDRVFFGERHLYQYPTCQELFGCPAFDPEGLLGSLSACTLTYLGLLTGRCLVHFQPSSRPSSSNSSIPKHSLQILTRWLCWAVILLLVAGCLCGFSQNGGAIPINKNLWSTSFVLIGAGSGLILLSLTYLLVDVWGVWSGSPFRFMGMNSILIYVGHEVFGGYFPFSFRVLDPTSHASLMVMNLIGAFCWVGIAFFMYKYNFFFNV